MNDNSKTIDETGAAVIDPRKALAEQTLAVDLAAVELDRAIATAHKFPRGIDAVVKKIQTLATYNRDAAENCVYALPRGGKPIIGPSIGFASIVAQCWGNCRVAAQIMYVDRKERVVVAAGRFFDLESNTETIVPVNRRIVDSKGRTYSDDMIQVTGMAAASIGARNSTLRGVPRGIWHPMYLAALGIVRGDVTTFAENKAKAISAMAQFGVKPEQIWLALALKGEAEFTLEHMPTLRGMYAALRDGSITVEEMFDPRRMVGRGFEVVENPLGGGDQDEPAAASSSAASAAAPVADETAGMGESPEPARVVAPATGGGGASAGPTVAAGAAGASGASTVASPAQAVPAASQAASEAAPAQAASPAKASGVVGLKNEDEYLSYWEGFCASATSVGALRDQWAADRSVRTQCRVVANAFDSAKSMMETREAELRKGGGR